jgi:hypothetical protein
MNNDNKYVLTEITVWLQWQEHLYCKGTWNILTDHVWSEFSNVYMCILIILNDYFVAKKFLK